ncbi:MAG TPA: hypothetical protein PLO14_08880, partial [Accumulibacter sp.]|nr:hypothetical protein [Accumulibacter sp.]
MLDELVSGNRNADQLAGFTWCKADHAGGKGSTKIFRAGRRVACAEHREINRACLSKLSEAINLEMKNRAGGIPLGLAAVQRSDQQSGRNVRTPYVVGQDVRDAHDVVQRSSRNRGQQLTTARRISPGHHRSVGAQRGKGTAR